MGFLEGWKGKLQVPEVPARAKKVGNNFVRQQVFSGANVESHIVPSEHRRHDLIQTSLESPFDKILFRYKGARRVQSDLPVLSAPDLNRIEDLSGDTEFSWDSLGSVEQFASTPEKVTSLWRGQFRFTTEDRENNKVGLRPPQIGALHAIAAHFAVGSDHDPATIVLPTGTGKTETMLANMVYRQTGTTLVLAPSDSLRTQLTVKFLTLGVLPKIEAVPTHVARPRVCKVTKAIRTVEEAKDIARESNVVIALPNTLQTSDQNAVDTLIDSCTDLFVDEAHHVTAATWSSVRDRFLSKKIVQFTATPFRRDGKRVDGKIIFNYKLGDAQDADYYRPINLVTVEEFGEQETRDRRIAAEAIARLQRDCSELGLDHVLMARTASKSRADDVLAIYRELAPDFNPVAVYSGPGRVRPNRQALEDVLDRNNTGARIIVCVDMLGEGFDFANLKIAALHDNHKSLAITLQFIGRFTRSGQVDEIGEATVVTNIADPEAERKLLELYAEGADWDKLIRRLSESRIEDELKLQDLVLNLKEKGDLHSQISLWNLRPALSTQIFRTTCQEWTPLNYKTALPRNAKTWYSTSEENNLLVAVVYRTAIVGWGNYQDLADATYDLILAWWDKGENALFIYATDYKGLQVEKMARLITDENTELVCGPAIFNILNNVELPLAKSLGSSRVGAISFTSYFGPNVTEGLASIEKAESLLNNIACVGYEDGDRVLWGGAQRRGKVWQQRSGTIADWVEWCARTWLKVSTEDDSDHNITRDFLRPIRLKAPYESWPIAIQWGERTQLGYSDKQFIRFGTDEVPLYLVETEIAEVDEDGALKIRLSSDDLAAEYTFRISADLPSGYSYQHSSGATAFYRRLNGEPQALEEFLEIDPFILRYADGTHSYNCYHVPVKLEAGVFPRDRIESIDWTGIPLNRESAHKEVNESSIQFRTFESIQEEYDVVFNDDGSGEAADLVAFKDIDESTIRLCLVHCKGAIGAKISNDIRNFYTVCGQAQKSIRTKHGGIASLYIDLKRRHEIWRREGYSRFLKGELRDLAYFKEKGRRSDLEFEVVIVQPGASRASVGEDILRLLATTEVFLTKTSSAIFRVIASD